MEGSGRPLARLERPLPSPGPGEALVQVAGCGVCHTDLAFLHQGVRTRGALPLVLGHEISGTVVALGAAADPGLAGRPVVVPAVLPCGECELCRAGHRTICRDQVMPGNDRDGGFASHVVVPARYLCPVPAAALARHELWQLAVISDAVATPFQAVRRVRVGPGDLVVVVGCGGIGVQAVQLAAASGAIVIGLDVNPARLEQAAAAGARAVLDVRELDAKALRQRVRAEAERLGAPSYRWKLFETSGTRAGQESAWALLGHGAALAVVGYTTERVEINLSNLMAFDAVARGNWGADPTLYPELLGWVADGKIALAAFVERHPLESINSVFDDAHHGRLRRRAVLVP